MFCGGLGEAWESISAWPPMRYYAGGLLHTTHTVGSGQEDLEVLRSGRTDLRTLSG